MVILLLVAADILIWRSIFFDGKLVQPEFYFFDVGQGDSQMVVLPGNVKVLIDGGPDSKVLDAMSRNLKFTDKYLDLIILTHPQLDHFGGLIDVINNFQVGAFIGAGRKGESLAYRNLSDAILAKKIPYIALKEGDAIKYKDYIFQILSPSYEDLLSAELNDTSLVMMLKSPELKLLYTGDSGRNIEKELMKRYDLSADVLKIGHHGSKNASAAEFLRAVAAKVSIIGVGKNNYGHPSKETLRRLADLRAAVFRTDQDGTLKLIFQEGKIKVFRSPTR